MGYRPAVLQPVAVATKFTDYTHICGRELIAEIRELAEPLKGKRVLHVSATAFGGGVSEILYTLVPLMRDVGLDCEWHVIYGREEFFNATKLMHNALQGAPVGPRQRAVGDLAALRDINARELSDGWDVCLITTPSPLRCASSCPEKAAAGCGAATSTSRRPTRTDRAAAALHRGLPRSRCSTCASYVPDGMRRQSQHRAARDRPADAEEHGALARGRSVRLRASSASTSTGR